MVHYVIYRSGFICMYKFTSIAIYYAPFLENILVFCCGLTYKYHFSCINLTIAMYTSVTIIHINSIK